MRTGRQSEGTAAPLCVLVLLVIRPPPAAHTDPLILLIQRRAEVEAGAGQGLPRSVLDGKKHFLRLVRRAGLTRCQGQDRRKGRQEGGGVDVWAGGGRLG